MTAKLISRRECSRRTGVPFKDLRPLLEEAGVRIHSIAKRIRVDEDDFAEFLESTRVPTRAETQDRADLLEQLAARKVLGR